ncbi:MAG: hypothetical protein JRG97_11200 [Deltaproteobacteria bacterium]|nr:hypothetical protein [Deltaproteobacteria bacterium]MBW2053440.1 hypothetical protein [Deltaproteobacteria bacterium]MBW2141619.1 hypothetical protein [Deltaproteobacteria bacterium]
MRQKSVPAAKARSTRKDVAKIVSLENRRAVSEMPRSQAEVERMLQQVKVSLEQMSREDLRKLYRLEGLVQVFSA